jgi:hypothetical protein
VRCCRTFGVLALAALLAGGATPRVARAQLFGTQLALSGWPLTVTNTTGNDFEAGAVSLGSTGFTVNATSNLLNLFSNRVTTVSVQCVAPCPRSGTTVATGLQWRRDDQAAWTTLSNAYVDIEQRTLTYNGANDPWGRTLHWRYVLNWTANPPAPASQYRVRFRLLVAAP